MTIYTQPNFNVGVWASDGNVAQPSTDKIELGHVVEKPKNEVMNWIQNRQDVGIAYSLQKGVPEWSNFTEYPRNAVIDYNGITYRCTTQHTGRQPANGSTFWRIAFSDYSLTGEVDRIKNQDGYLTHYVQKSSPVMVGRALGNGFAAASGDVLNSGYSFKDSANTGMYYKDNKLIFKLNGTVLGMFGGGNTENSSVVTKQQLDAAIATVLESSRIKVGDLYLTSNTAPAETTLGYGKWEKYGEGRALVGHSGNVTSSVPDWVKRGGGTFGEYDHTLTLDQIPSHRHSIYGGGGGEGGTWTDTTSGANENTSYTEMSGGGKAHNNVQPSIVVYVWRRTA